MTAPPRSDALVFFGATGDLAYKQIFPALQAMVRTGVLNVPVIGIDRLCSLLRYVDGDYNDVATFKALRREVGGAERPLHYLAIPPSAFAPVVSGLDESGCAAHARVAVEKPFGRDLASARALNEETGAISAEHVVRGQFRGYGPRGADRLVAGVPGGWRRPIDPRASS
jgi:glucose-6-phosphate 1-dehydrogenase